MVRSWTFHITGGALCLDFANTLSWRRSSQPIERLGDFADLASWARQAGVITHREELRLNREAQHHPRRAVHTLKTARALREATFGVFAAISEGRRPADHDLRRVADWVQQALNHSALIRTDGHYRWSPVAASIDSLQHVLFRVALSANELLTSVDTAHIGQCSGPDCRWLWIDRTRNHSRRWCDMAICGNRAKARRHYARTMTA